METLLLIQMIFAEATLQGFDPKVAAAVAKVESNFNTKAVGPIGELGLFQIRPEFSKLKRNQLLDPATNIREGIKMLVAAKTRCVHKAGLTWAVCYNAGMTAAKRIKKPSEFPYVKKIEKYIGTSNALSFQSRVWLKAD